MEAIPAIMKQQKQILKSNIRAYCSWDLSKFRWLSVFLKDLTTALNKSKLNTDEKEQIKNKAKTAVHAIVAYTNWLKDLENKTPRSFRLGSKLYSEKFDLIFNRVALTPFLKGSHKKELHEKCFD
jgi:hypothetical protein